MASIFRRLILPTPDHSVYFKTSPWVTLALASLLGLCEVLGLYNLTYSKFFKPGSRNNRYVVPSKRGMLACYVPPFIASLASLVLLVPRRSTDDRFLLLSLALTLHFFKRTFEVQFIHKYSGKMVIDSIIMISSGYISIIGNMIYFHYKHGGSIIAQLDHENQPPIIDMKHFGFAMFLIGIGGNFYHHFLLSKLRKNGEKNMSYKIPRGGLFGLVICPHYLFEIIGFFGVFFISQTLCALCLALGTMFYLIGRSFVTRKWYLSKFEDFPREVKALIPFVF